VSPGFLPANLPLAPGVIPAIENATITHLFGAGSFDHGNEESRFAVFIDSGTTDGTRLEAAWKQMQIEVTDNPQEPPEDGPLSYEAKAAGAGIEPTTLRNGRVVTKVQKALTDQREEKRFLGLPQRVNNLPADDERRMAFMGLNDFSTQFVNSCPLPGEVFGNTDLHQCYADYYGRPGAQFAPHVGMQIARTGRTLDPFGWNLTLANMVGGGWTKRHDASKFLIAQSLSECAMPYTLEVYGVFASVLDQESGINDEPRRKVQGMVPDFLITLMMNEELAELKCTGQTRTDFNHTTVLKRCGGVEKRAGRVDGDYHRKARKADAKYNGFDHAAAGNGSMGPMEQRLTSFGRVRALVIGPRAECSSGLKGLVTAMSEVGAEAKWRNMGARSVVGARGVIKNRLRRMIGINAAKANAVLKRERLGIALGNGQNAYKRRYNAFTARKMREEFYDQKYGQAPSC